MYYQRIHPAFNLFFCLTFLFSLVGVPPVQAASLSTPPQNQANPDAAPTPPPPPAGARMGYNDVTGRLNFVGGDAAAPLARAGELSALGVRSAADGVLAHYAPQFGVQNPAKDLRLARTTQDNNGSAMRYQQTYQGIPILGGELVVNSDTQGQVLSLNGEVSPNLDLPTTTPAITGEQALQAALAGAKLWYGLEAAQVVASQPALWIYDPRILKEDNDNPVGLVWRLELRANASSGPVDELVLVDAASGVISLHFSQVEGIVAPADNLPPEPIPTETPADLPGGEPTLSLTPEASPTAQPTQAPTEPPVFETTPTTPPAEPGPAQVPHQGEIQALSGIAWYVVPAPAGSDENECAAPATACATINGAIGKASDGDVIDIAVGTYTGTGTEVVKIGKNVNLSGGWNADFTSQAGFSTIDGQNQRVGVVIGQGDASTSQPPVTSTIERLIVMKGQQTSQTSYGSGIFADANSSVTVKNSSVHHNSAYNDKGFAISSRGGNSFSLLNTTVGENKGGVQIIGAVQAVEINNDTITRNSAPGSYSYNGLDLRLASTIPLIFTNNIIANNNCYFSYNATISSTGFNLLYQCSGGYQSKPGDLIGVDSKLGQLIQPGYYPLLAGSPIIDGGSPIVPGSGGKDCETTDQLGNIRPIDGDSNGAAVCDMGAFETHPLTPPAARFITIQGSSSLTCSVNMACPAFSIFVQDQYGLPFPGAQVTFTAPETGASGYFGTSGVQVTVTSGSDGMATAPTFIANGTTGKFTLDVTSPGIALVVYAMENYIAIATSVAPAESASVGLVHSHISQVKAIVRDNYNNPMPGIAVTFTAPAAGATLIFAGSQGNSFTVNSDASGIAAVSVSANDISGTYPISAAAQGVSQTANLMVTNNILFVSPTGSDGTDLKNDCRSAAAPCLNVGYAVNTVTIGPADVRVEKGVYNTGIDFMGDIIYVLGGWDPTFTIQDGYSKILGAATPASGLGIYIHKGVIEISRFIIQNKDTGILIYGQLTLRDSALIGNSTGLEINTTGFAPSDGSATVINSTFAGNGEAIYNERYVTLQNVTIAHNHTGIHTEGGVGMDEYAYLQNSLIAANTDDCVVGDGSVFSLGSNLFGKSPGCHAYAKGSFFPNDTDLTAVDPGISQSINDQYIALLPGSPAIDAITGPGTYCPATDQRGVPRPVGAACDIGAYEYSGVTPPYTFTQNSGSGQAIFTGKPAWAPLMVQLIDSLGAPVPGVTVTFSAPASGASAIFNDSRSLSTTVETDASGIAISPLFTTNMATGDYVITASIEGTTAPVNFAVTNEGFGVYVDGVSGNDTNDCRTPATPCQTFPSALSKIKNMEALAITAGTYALPDYSTQIISKQIYVVGGWNSTFSAQTGQSIMQGKMAGSGISPALHTSGYVFTDHLDIIGGVVNNTGTLIFTNGAMAHLEAGIVNYGNMTLINASVFDDNCNRTISTYCTYSHSGAIHNYSGNLTLTNVTLTGTYSYDGTNQGAGIYNESGNVYLQNSIVANNRSSTGFGLSGKITSLGHNLIDVVDLSQFTPAAGDLYGSGYLHLGAHLSEPADNGGGTLTVAPLPGSPAAGAGDPQACPPTDQRGAARPVGSACTIGAYEGVVSSAIPVSIVRLINYQNRYQGILCQTPQPTCTGGKDPGADKVYQVGTDFVNFIRDHFKRDSLDDAGMPVIVYIHTYVGTEWDGYSVFIQDNYNTADDIIAHELTHGFTQFTAGLYNYSQSGAINESLADMWGEYIDQTNGQGNDSSAVRWLIGEDAKNGPYRSMSNPPAYKQPDKRSSPYYLSGGADSAGVHANGGINNKAAFLMVDGGPFNGFKISPLGWEKTNAIYYYALTHLLTSASDYADLYVALGQACQVLTGGEQGITSADCQQARNATNAVEMDHHANPQVTANCPVGSTKVPNDPFFGGFENGSSAWVFGANVGTNRWSIVDQNAIDGQYALFGDDIEGHHKDSGEPVTDTYAAMKNDVIIPHNLVTYLYFRHSYAFAYGYSPNIYYRDGGVLEYSTDHGATWMDAIKLFDSGKSYTGTISKWAGDDESISLIGHKAFAGLSNGYLSSRFNLTSLSGKPVRFRWRFVTNYTISNLGWFVDDVNIYTCVGNPGVPALVSPANKALVTGYTPKLDWKDAANTDHYWLQVAYDPDFNHIFIEKKDLTLSEFTPNPALPDNKTYYWRVLTVNSIDVSSSWSSVFSFRTPMQPPDMLKPTNNDAPSNLRPTFQWALVDTATSYSLQVSTSAAFSSTLINVTQSSLTYTPTGNLTANKTIYWRVKANGANPSNWSNPFSFSSPNPPSTPSLASPTDKSLVSSRLPRLDWSTSTLPSGATFAYYRLQIASDSSFSSLVQDMQVKDGLSVSEKTLTIPLDPDHTFYWRVSAYNSLGQFSAWSSVRSLRTPMDAPSLSEPVNNDHPATARPTFLWDSVPWATSYSLQVSTSSLFTSTVVNITANALTYTPTSDLPHGASLFWRVKANGINPSNWSAPLTFTNANPPAIPSLVSPADGSILTGYLPFLDWNDPTGADYYEVQISTSNTFDSGIDQVGIHGDPSSFTPPAPLAANRTFYWRVRAYNNANQYSAWSAVRHFHTQLNPPGLSSPGNGTTLPTPIVLNWGSVDEATGYTVQISTSLGFGTTIVNKTVPTTSYPITTSLTKGKTYYWRVQTKGNNPSPWSETWSFIVQ